MVSRPAKNSERTVKMSAVPEPRVRESSRRCMKIRSNKSRKRKAEGINGYPSAYFIGKFCLVDQCLLISSDALAEHIVCPALIGKHNWDEDQSNDGHHCQRVLGGGSVVDGQR